MKDTDAHGAMGDGQRERKVLVLVAFDFSESGSPLMRSGAHLVKFPSHAEHLWSYRPEVVIRLLVIDVARAYYLPDLAGDLRRRFSLEDSSHAAASPAAS